DRSWTWSMVSFRWSPGPIHSSRVPASPSSSELALRWTSWICASRAAPPSAAAHFATRASARVGGGAGSCGSAAGWQDRGRRSAATGSQLVLMSPDVPSSPMSKSSFVAELEVLTRNDRVRRAVEMGRKAAAGDASAASLLDELRRSPEAYERLLSLVS